MVHVAGTNGKGSVTRMLAEALRRSGLRVGATTSPHLVSFTERIEVDGVPVSQGDVAAGLAEIRPVVEDLDGRGEVTTFFEVVTVLAFLLFRGRVDWAVVETGMGGRLDATNVVVPDLTVITNVGLDHTQFLGATVGEIALEKAGIMKAGVPCVTACDGEALAVLKVHSHALRVPMSIVGGDYSVVPDRHGLVLLRPNGESFYEVGLAGGHQRTNAAVVVAAVDALRLQGVVVPERALCDALRLTGNRGRLELFRVPCDDLVAGSPADVMEVLVDGAHNPVAARALRAYLVEEGWRGFHLVVGFCADKDWRAALDEWLLPSAHVWAVPVRNPRSLDPGAIVAFARDAGVRADVARDVEAALSAAVRDGGRRVVVAGSLFLAGEAVAFLSGESLEEIRGAQ